MWLALLLTCSMDLRANLKSSEDIICGSYYWEWYKKNDIETNLQIHVTLLLLVAWICKFIFLRFSTVLVHC